MKLIQQRIRTTTKLLSNIAEEASFVLGVKINTEIETKLKEKTNITEIKRGVLIFPTPFLGIMSKRNSIGEYIPEKNKPKETAYRAQEWTIKDWGGYEHTGTDYVPYKRYPRKFIEPKEFKLIIKEMDSKEKIVQINKVFQNNKENHQDILFAANLMLEIIGVVEAFNLDGNNKIIEIDTVETVNWEILPSGERIWESFAKKQKGLLSKSEKTLIRERFEFINEFQPDSIKKGIGGYTGYLVFEFKNKDIFIFDSIVYGDATYIFDNNWEYVSKLTKKEIITQGLAKDRIIHNKLWKRKVENYLKE
ncbi:MAG: hypothetical protein ACTJGH_04665 [Peptoniphilaceae bacterium]